MNNQTRKMNKKMNFAAIIAVVMVTLSAMWFTSCTADDEYGNFEFDTLAEGLVTRSGDPGTSSSTSIELLEGNVVVFEQILSGQSTFDFSIKATFSWKRGPLSSVDASVNIQAGENTSQLLHFVSGENAGAVKEYQIISIYPKNAIVRLYNNIFAMTDLVKVKYSHRILEEGVIIENVDSVNLSVECSVEDYRSDKQNASSIF